LWQRLSRNGSAKLCVSSFVEPAVLLLKSPACILPSRPVSHLFHSPLLIIVIRSCSRCIGERRSTCIQFLLGSPPFSRLRYLDNLEQKAHATTPEIRLLSSNHTSTSYRAFRTIPDCEACPPPTYDWLDISPSKLQLSCSCSRLARANCPAKLPHPYWHTTIDSSSQRRRPLPG